MSTKLAYNLLTACESLCASLEALKACQGEDWRADGLAEFTRTDIAETVIRFSRRVGEYVREADLEERIKVAKRIIETTEHVSDVTTGLWVIERFAKSEDEERLFRDEIYGECWEE